MHSTANNIYSEHVKNNIFEFRFPPTLSILALFNVFMIFFSACVSICVYACYNLPLPLVRTHARSPACFDCLARCECVCSVLGSCLSIRQHSTGGLKFNIILMLNITLYASVFMLHFRNTFWLVAQIYKIYNAHSHSGREREKKKVKQIEQSVTVLWTVSRMRAECECE